MEMAMVGVAANAGLAVESAVFVVVELVMAT